MVYGWGSPPFEIIISKLYNKGVGMTPEHLYDMLVNASYFDH